jgi:glycosyltransferase involved in cell wall biosynthesis
MAKDRTSLDELRAKGFAGKEAPRGLGSDTVGPLASARVVTSRSFLVTCVGPAPVQAPIEFGSYSYSYQVVARRFAPLLARLGPVRWLDRPESRLEYAAYRARQENQTPVRVAFQPLQDFYPSRSAPDVVFPFWEFPDLPDEPLEWNLRYVWARMAGQVSLILTSSSFTAEAFARAGVRVPVRVVPVPLPEEWFAVPAWEGPRTVVLPVQGYELCPGTGTAVPASSAGDRPAGRSVLRQTLRWFKSAYVKRIRPRLPTTLDGALTGLAHGCRSDLRRLLKAWWPGALPSALPPPDPAVRLSGIVYTMVLQPSLRKALHDLVTAFVWALRDRDDATLVLRLVSRPQELPHNYRQVLEAYRVLEAVPHRCRVVLVTGSMSDEQMRALAAQTTYYVNATRAEGCCLPIQEMLAAGRPALSPIHTAMRDYFDASVGFVVESHPEPSPFPNDHTGRLKTTRHRLVWQSLHDQFQASYAVAQDPAAYGALAARARQRMREYAAPERVQALLQEALEDLPSCSVSAPETAVPATATQWPEAGPGPRAARAPLYIAADALTAKEMTGIGRYLGLLIQHLARSTEICLLTRRAEIPVNADNLPRWGGDLYAWRDALLRLPHRRRNRARVQDAACVYPFLSPGKRRFTREVAIVHDLSPLIVPGVAVDPLREAFFTYCRRHLPRLDGILCDSEATRADVAWLTGIDAATITVAYPGPSLCVAGHVWGQPVRRSPQLLLAVGVHHPRKNGDFLFDWFWETAALPAGMELWWAGPNSRASRAALRPRSNPFGRRVRLLGLIPDPELCRLYQAAQCLICPSLYEGFGFPVLDALLHGTPVLCGRHSSLTEFEGPGVFYFDPCDPASLDRAFRDLRAADPLPLCRDDLRARCTWEGLAGAVARLCA